MSDANGKKSKSGIPIIRKNNENTQEPKTTGANTNSNRDLRPESVGLIPVSETQLQQPGPGPGHVHFNQAKAKPQLIIDKKSTTKQVSKTSKNVKINNNSNEIWQDEKAQSVSQNLQVITNTEHERRREGMAQQIKMLEDELVKMGGLLEKRKKVMEEVQEEAKKQQESMENIIADQQSLMIKNGIDPVTGESIPTGGDGQGDYQNKFTKKKVQEMREKLRNMNEHTKASLLEIEKTLSEIDDLEKASERARSHSPDTVKMLQQLADNGEFKLAEEGSQLTTPDMDSKDGGLDEYTMEKFGPQIFLTDADREIDFESSDIEVA